MKHSKKAYEGNFLLATTDIPEAYPYETFVQSYMDSTGCPRDKVPASDSDAYYQWAADCRDQNCQDTLENIGNCKDYDTPCVITGTLGLWKGHRDIIPEVTQSVQDAVKRILRGNYMDWELRFDNGCLRMSCHHHDGTNSFTISALSARGLRSLERAKSRYDDFDPQQDDMKRIPYLYAI